MDKTAYYYQPGLRLDIKNARLSDLYSISAYDKANVVLFFQSIDKTKALI